MTLETIIVISEMTTQTLTEDGGFKILKSRAGHIRDDILDLCGTSAKSAGIVIKIDVALQEKCVHTALLDQCHHKP